MGVFERMIKELEKKLENTDDPEARKILEGYQKLAKKLRWYDAHIEQEKKKQTK